MDKLKILVLTDHRKHSMTNSIYALTTQLTKEDRVEKVHVVSRGNAENDSFFYDLTLSELEAYEVREDFEYQSEGKRFFENTTKVHLTEYDWILLRLPRPIPPGFFEFLTDVFYEHHIINRPSGILRTSSKAFLMELEEGICPPMQMIHSQEDLERFKARFSIVLKPLLNYGGQGVLRIENDLVWEGNQSQPYADWIDKMKEEEIEYLGMQYLKNVDQGDKRIVVCNGEVITAAVRYPAPGSWMCNVAQGGHAETSTADENELAIIQQLTPIMHEQGVVLYGIDTLVNNEGQRVLSEVNTLSIGGIAPQGPKAVQKTIENLLDYMQNQTS